MKTYILRRLILIIPTLFAILLANFLIVQLAPGGPIEYLLAKFSGEALPISALITEGQEQPTKYQARQGVDLELIEELKVQFGFDKPILERFKLMVMRYVRFDLGQSFLRITVMPAKAGMTVEGASFCVTVWFLPGGGMGAEERDLQTVESVKLQKL